MSILAALLDLDGKPLGPEAVASLLAPSGGPSAGIGAIVIDGPAGLGLAAAPSAAGEAQQPLWDESREVCLAFTGRLDNAEEIAGKLEARQVRLRPLGDPEVVLKAYLRMGPAFLSGLIGDFALALWDARRRAMLCARDPVGVKPLYYRMERRTFSCGSRLRQLLRGDASSEPINEGMAGEYLACAITHPGETLYRHLHRLPPAHAVIVTQDRMRTWRYWEPGGATEIRYRSDAEYAEHFRDLFREAVRCRIRGSEPVGILLSGGLDSASVTGMAAAVSRDEGGPPPQTFSQIYPGMTCDESGWIRRVVERSGLVSHQLPYHPQLGGRWYSAQAGAHLDFPGYPDDTSTLGLHHAARDRGIRIVLTGFGGDEWLSGSRWHYADLVRSLSLRRLIRRSVSDEALAARPAEPRAAVLKYGLWPQLPVALRRAGRRLLGRSAVPPWVDGAFARRIGLEERIRREIVRGSSGSFARAELQATLEDGGLSHGLEMEDRLAAHAGVEQRHPFHDRRIIEFAFALPEEQRCRPGMPKWILRKAMAPWLPAEILARPGKAEFSPVFARALHEVEGAHAFSELAAAGRGWIDGIVVTRLHEELAGLRFPEAASGSVSWPLWMIYGIDLWLKAVAGDARARRTASAPDVVEAAALRA